jgi:hypothetical protein
MDDEIKKIISDIIGIEEWKIDYGTEISEWIVLLAEKIRNEGYKKQ